MSGSENIAWARKAPAQQPRIWIAAEAPASRQGNAPRSAWTKDTAGLKCAPLTGPRSAIKVARTATVAPVFAMSATAKFPAASRSAMIPEPITVAASRSEPKPSAAMRRNMTLDIRCRGAMPDRAQLLAQRHWVQGCDRQLSEEPDSGFKLLERLSKRQGLVRIRAFHCCRIRDAPVCRHGLSGPYWANLAGGVVADGEDKVDRRRVPRRELVPALAAKAFRWQIHAFKKIERQRIYLAFGEAAGAKAPEPTTAPVS